MILVPNIPLGTQLTEAPLHVDEIRETERSIRRSQAELGNEKTRTAGGDPRVTSFPTSRWERSLLKLRFTPMKSEKQSEAYGVPKRSLGTR